MNLMFRKNFEKSGGAGGGGGGGGGGIAGGGGIGGGLVEGVSYTAAKSTTGGIIGGGGAGVRRSRGDFPGIIAGSGGGGGYYPMTSMEHEHSGAAPAYRTHLLFAPHAGVNANDDYSGGGGGGGGDRFGPGPRRTSAGGPHLIKWGGQGGQPPQQQQQPQPMQRRKQSGLNKDIYQADLPLTPTTASRQVSFHGNRQGLLVQGNSPARSEPITLATLDRDCFIIPLASLERFLPAGVPSVPAADKKRPGSPLSVLEVEDPKQCILAHFMTQLEPLEPLVESPVSRPLVLQRDTAAELLSELSASASQSILLTNMERNADFPFITYYVVNKQKTDPIDFYQEVQCAALKKFDPRDLRYAANHNLDLFNEVATIARPPLEPTGGRPPIPSTGYIVSIFKVFEGDDGLKFEQNWLYWTGARMMYRYLPRSVGLRRITLHKSMSQGDKTYLLICECSQLQENLSAAAILLPALRARLCGYVGLYRPSVCY